MLTSSTTLFILPLLLSAGVALLVSPLVIKLYGKFGWLDDPKKNDHEKVIHSKPVPRGGGIVIFSSLLIATIVFVGIDKHSIGILLGALLLTIVGIYDDVTDSNPYFRLFLGFLGAITVVAAGIGIAYITNPFGSGVIHLNQPQIAFNLGSNVHTIWILADALALVWIVWCMNMLNWSKGLDGQLPGVVVIAATVIAILSFKFQGDVTQWPVSQLAAITAGAFLGFLPWNFYPQKMMPGYGAGSLAGYLLAVLSILSGAKLATLILVLAIPMIDAIYVIFRRLTQRKSPVWGDRSHFHHRLLDLGWSKRKIAYFYWFISLVLGIIALQLNARQKAFTILLLLLLFGGVLLWIRFLTTFSRQAGQDNG